MNNYNSIANIYGTGWLDVFNKLGLLDTKVFHTMINDLGVRHLKETMDEMERAIDNMKGAQNWWYKGE